MNKLLVLFVSCLVFFSCSEETMKSEDDSIEFEVYSLMDLDLNLKESNSIIVANFLSGSIEPIYRYDSIALQHLVNIINEEESEKFVLVGHSNSQGGDQANVKLSLDRSRFVKEDFIEKFNLASGQIDNIGEGETNPIYTNETQIGRAKNSRVELRIIF